MSPSRVAACIGFGTLLVAWLASAIGVSPSPRQARAPRPNPDDARVVALASDVQSQAARLRKRLASPAALQPPSRNPFTFAARERWRRDPQPAEAAAAAAPDALAPAATEPMLALIGIAEDKADGGVVRTAMITGEAEDLFLVVRGDSVAGRYEVVAIGADAVELKDLTTGAIRRLALR
jgi:hypothetical protein